MSIVPTTPEPAATTPEHPGWCERKHAAEWPVHEMQVGVDLELSHDLAYAVRLQQVHGAPAEVLLVQHTRGDTRVTRLTPLETSMFRELFSEALQLLAAEVGR